MIETKVELSPTCYLELCEWESFQPQLTLNYTEHSPAHGYSDTLTDIDLSTEKAAEIIMLLQSYIAAKEAQ